MIIFSQWHSVLLLLSDTLAANGIASVTCEGTIAQQEKAMERFKSGAVKVRIVPSSVTL
jgi:SNF2 family DNA or RNA helicase